MADNQDFETPLFLDKKMEEAFDWSNDNIPVRDALWDHYMESNNHDTMKTEQEMEKFLNMDNDKVKEEAEKLLKK